MRPVWPSERQDGMSKELEQVISDQEKEILVLRQNNHNLTLDNGNLRKENATLKRHLQDLRKQRNKK